MEKIYLGFSTQLDSTIQKDIEFALKNGFNALCVDLSWRPETDFSEQEVAALASFSSNGNRIVIHMPFYMPTNTGIPEIAEGVFLYFKKVLAFAKKIGASSLTFHSGYVEQLGDRKTHKYLISNLKRIAPLAKNMSIDLSIENDDKKSDYPLWDLNECKEVLERVDGLKFTYDPGHANTTKYSAFKFFEKVKEFTNTVHLHNNSGNDSHDSLDEGNLPFDELLPLFRRSKKDITYILELHPYKKLIYNKKLVLSYLKSLED